MKICEVKGCCWPVFGKDKKTGVGYCRMHQTLRTDTDKRSIAQKSMEKARGEGKGEEEKGNTELWDWFQDKMVNSVKICENCGASLKHYNEKDWHGSQHHVLDKSLYDSVKVHPLNHLVLGKWCCHSQWHTSWENAAKMKIFPKAIDIIAQLFPILPREERKRLPEVVIQEIKPETYNSK